MGYSSVGLGGMSLSTFYTNVRCAAKRGDPHQARQLYALLPAGRGRVVARGSGVAVGRVLRTRVVNGEILAGSILDLTRAGHRDRGNHEACAGRTRD